MRERPASRLGPHGPRAIPPLPINAVWVRQQLREQSDPRSDAAAWTVINLLPAHPVVTVPVVAVAAERTRPAVANGMVELQRAGLLIPLTASHRDRVWEVGSLLDLVVRLESGDR